MQGLACSCSWFSLCCGVGRLSLGLQIDWPRRRLIRSRQVFVLGGQAHGAIIALVFAASGRAGYLVRRHNRLCHCSHIVGRLQSLCLARRSRLLGILTSQHLSEWFFFRSSALEQRGELPEASDCSRGLGISLVLFCEFCEPAGGAEI